MSSNHVVQLPNEHLEHITNDYLFHLGISLDENEITAIFRDVKFVCVGGTAPRMMTLASHLRDALQNGFRSGEQSNDFDFSRSTDRYALYKCGPAICVTHGIGTPSANIVLQEVFKLLQKAGASDVILIRIGTCGGIGVPAGTMAISTGVLTPGLRPVFRTSSLGKVLELPVTVDQDLANEIYNMASRGENGVKVVKGKTYCADGFYEAQGRLDGAFCGYTQKERLQFLQHLQMEGVVNMEMESAGVLALCHRAGIKAAVVCGILVNRLEEDLPDMTKCKNVQDNLLHLITAFIKHKLAR